jgi:hypothetical protein
MIGEPFSLVRRRISVNTGVWTFPQRPLGAVFIEILPQSLQLLEELPQQFLGLRRTCYRLNDVPPEPQVTRTHEARLARPRVPRIS